MIPTLIHKIAENINSNDFYMKREDLLPFSFGGNKARKAVYFFDDIEKENSDVVVTYGSNESNHCRIIANMAKSKNIPCYIISPEEKSENTYNKKIVSLLDGKTITAPLSEIKSTIDKTIIELCNKGYKPYFIQGGGHGTLGTLAYVDAYNEIHEYEKKNNIKFDYIFHASGTGTTQAGLISGKIINRTDVEIVGISIARTSDRGKSIIIESVKDFLGDSYDENVIFIDDYILGGYSKFNNEIITEIRSFLCTDGIALNTTYTGKAFWGMKKYIKKNNITGKNILFINTGGLPIFFDNLEEQLL